MRKTTRLQVLNKELKVIVWLDALLGSLWDVLTYYFNFMSVIGQNPSRDKKAHRIIYGGFSGYVALINFLAGCMGAPPAASMANNRRKKSYQDRAWEIYSQTGDIKKAIKIFFWDP